MIPQPEESIMKWKWVWCQMHLLCFLTSLETGYGLTPVFSDNHYQSQRNPGSELDTSYRYKDNFGKFPSSFPLIHIPNCERLDADFDPDILAWKHRQLQCLVQEGEVQVHSSILISG